MRLAMVIAALAALLVTAGCRTSNQALKTEHQFWRVAQDESDETLTIARLDADRTVVTDFNLKYTLAVRARAGDYVLAATDAGGRYFTPRGYGRLTLTYKGLTLLGDPSPEYVDGGLYLDKEGHVFLYWFWGTDKPTRVAAPGTAVSVSLEVDRDKVNARLDREQREELARRAAIAEKEAEAARARQAAADAEEREKRAKEATARIAAAVAEIADARAKARAQCPGVAQCDRDFARAQAYLLQQADMRVQVATPTLIETYNAQKEGDLQLRLLRVPTSGERWEITLTAHCKAEINWLRICADKELLAYSGFTTHMGRR